MVYELINSRDSVKEHYELAHNIVVSGLAATLVYDCIEF